MDVMNKIGNIFVRDLPCLNRESSRKVKLMYLNLAVFPQSLDPPDMPELRTPESRKGGLATVMDLPLVITIERDNSAYDLF